MTGAVSAAEFKQTWKRLIRRATLPMRQAAYKLRPASTARWLTVAEEGTRLRQFFGHGLWNVDVVRGDLDDVLVEGWAVTAHPPEQLGLRGNGTVAERSSFGQPNVDFSPIYGYVSHARTSGFSARVPSDTIDGPELRLELCHRRLPLPGLPPFFALVDPVIELALPDADRMRRVHGDANPVAFLMAGYNVFRRLEEALRSATGRGFEPGMRVLDWGCGSGRIARWFAHRPGVLLTGVDVDRDNVSWCAANVPFGDFRAIALHPPMPLADASVDVLIGVSVFTHLTEAVQFEWLRELKRVVRPGGHVLVSVHAFAAAAQQSGWPLSLLAEWQERGFVDGKSPDLDGLLDEPGYYRTTFHHPTYIAREWTKLFARVELLEGYLGNQALAVLHA